MGFVSDSIYSAFPAWVASYTMQSWLLVLLYMCVSSLNWQTLYSLYTSVLYLHLSRIPTQNGTHFDVAAKQMLMVQTNKTSKCVDIDTVDERYMHACTLVQSSIVLYTANTWRLLVNQTVCCHLCFFRWQTLRFRILYRVLYQAEATITCSEAFHVNLLNFQINQIRTSSYFFQKSNMFSCFGLYSADGVLTHVQRNTST